MTHEFPESDLRHVLAQTQSFWPRLAGSNVLLTGASGFVGSWLVETFLWANRQLKLGARLYALTRHPETLRSADTSLLVLTGDIKSFRFPSAPLHYIIHAAVEHETTNLPGAQHLLEIARTYGDPRILFTSSGAVYGEQPSTLSYVAEDFIGTPLPDNIYAQGKLELEQLLLNSGPDVVIARLFAFAGPKLPLDKNFAVGNFVRDALRGGPICIEGDGTPLRSYLYAADLAVWLWTMLIHGAPARTYNVGSDQPVSILELARSVERVCGVTRGVSVAQVPASGEQPKRYIPSIARARSELNLQPLVTLEDGIQRMYEWYQNYTSTK